MRSLSAGKEARATKRTRTDRTRAALRGTSESEHTHALLDTGYCVAVDPLNPEPDDVLLWRPTGQAELDLVASAGWFRNASSPKLRVRQATYRSRGGPICKASRGFVAGGFRAVPTSG